MLRSSGICLILYIRAIVTFEQSFLYIISNINIWWSVSRIFKHSWKMFLRYYTCAWNYTILFCINCLLSFTIYCNIEPLYFNSVVEIICISNFVDTMSLGDQYVRCSAGIVNNFDTQTCVSTVNLIRLK